MNSRLRIKWYKNERTKASPRSSLSRSKRRSTPIRRVAGTATLAEHAQTQSRDQAYYEITPRELKHRQSHSNKPRVTLNLGGDNLIFYPDGDHRTRRINQSLSNHALGGSYKFQTMKNFANEFSFALPPETERKRRSSRQRMSSITDRSLSFNRAKSEIARQHRRDGVRKSQTTRIMELDPQNIRKVQEPNATKTVEQFMIPEGMAGTESSLGGQPSRPSLKWELSQSSSPRDKVKLFEQAMKYRFKLEDIGKYSQRLKSKDVNWKFERSAMGKIIPSDAARMKRL